jgi:hypothetical protein
MTDHDLEQRLRAWYQADIDDRERAPQQLRTDLATLVQAAAGSRRPQTAGWRFPPMNRFAPFALAATAVVVVILVGIGLFVRLSPIVGPPPFPSPTHSFRAPAWTITGNMIEARTDHTATLLPDGRVLVVGGTGIGGQVLASAELYDPASGTWTSTGNMIEARTGHVATLLRDGTVLVAGGRNRTTGSLRGIASAELYDPSSGTWRSTGNMIDVPDYPAATLLRDGTVLVGGGLAELYDPSSGVWRATGNPIEGGRHEATALLANGKVLVAGGGDDNSLASAELYDPSSGTWTATGRMSEGRTFITATRLPDGRVLVAGGYGISNGSVVELASAELYDPVSGTWTVTGSMSESRGRLPTDTLLPDGKVLAAGGCCAGNGYLATAELYDAGSGTWAATASMDEARSGHTATLLNDGRVVVAGGYNVEDPLTPLASAELYDPGNGS